MSPTADGAWVGLAVLLVPDEVDAVSGSLWAAGVLGIEERDRPDGTVELVASMLADRLPAARAALAARPHRVEPVRDPRAPELPAGDVVVAPGVSVRIAAGRSFGWGGHVTTRLALEVMRDELRSAATVLDVGTGSGVLAVAAAHLGAGSVTAVDTDPEAVEVARRNVRANPSGGAVDVRQGSVDVARGRYDLVVANLEAPVLRELAADLEARLAPAGRLVLSGFLEAREPGIRDAFERVAFDRRRTEDEWVALAGGRPDELRTPGSR